MQFYIIIYNFLLYTQHLFLRESAFQYMLDRPEFNAAMHAGSCIAQNTEFNQMVKCQVIKQLEVVMTHSIHFSVKLVQESTYHEQFSLTLSQLWLVCNSDIFLRAQFHCASFYKGNRTNIFLVRFSLRKMMISTQQRVSGTTVPIYKTVI